MKDKQRKIFSHPTYKDLKVKTLAVNEVFDATCKVIGKDGEIKDAQVIYKSDNEDILKVDEKGRVTALKEGYGEILAFSMGKLARIGLDVMTINKENHLFTGHRGVRGEIIENTLASFSKAISYGFDYIESDILITKDKNLVMFHDENNVSRLLNSDKKISELTLDEIKTLKFINGNSYQDYSDERVPTFKEYLELIKNSNSYPMIELKDSHLHENEDLLLLIRDMINEYGFKDTVRVTSATIENIIAYSKICNDHELWYITEEKFDDLELLLKYNFNLSIKHNVASKEFCKSVIENNLKVDLWVVNDRKLVKKYLSWPITSMTSDYLIFDK